MVRKERLQDMPHPNEVPPASGGDDDEKKKDERKM